MSPLSLNMPLILNTPANKIQIHFFHLPVTQWEVLLVNVLTDPILYESIIASPCYLNDPTFQQAIVLFQNYSIPSFNNSLLDLQSHVFPYRSLRPLTLPSQPLTPAYLSCWWTRDSTNFSGHFLETTLP